MVPLEKKKRKGKTYAEDIPSPDFSWKLRDRVRLGDCISYDFSWKLRDRVRLGDRISYDFSWKLRDRVRLGDRISYFSRGQNIRVRSGD